MIYLYQIGSVKLHLHSQRFKEVAHTAEVKGIDFLWSSKKAWGDKRDQPDIQQQSLSGLLLSDCNHSANQIFKRLQSMVGFECDLIGYFDYSCCSDETGCACGAPASCQLVWLQTRGILKSIKATNRDNDIAVDLEAELEYQDTWQPLNRLFWNFTAFDPPIVQKAKATPSDIPAALGFYPSCSGLFSKSGLCRQFKKTTYTDPLLAYNPDIWPDIIGHLMPDYPVIGEAYGWRTGTALSEKYELYIDNNSWNFAPLSMYAFRNLPNNTNNAIRILIERQKGLWERETETVIVDLNALDIQLNLAGYSGLDPADILYIGDLTRRPGFIVRNGAIIPDFRPIVEYTSEFPGFISPGIADVEIEVPIGSEFASSHVFRCM